MALYSRARLLASLAAVLGLCAAGAGCQSPGVCRDGCECPPAVSAPPGCQVCQGSGDAHRGVFVTAGRPTTQEPALAPSCASGCCSCAVMLRPVPVASSGGDGPLLPVQRVSGEAPVVSSNLEATPVATMDRPQPLNYVPATRPDVPVLTPVAAGSGDNAPVAAPPPPRAVNILPPPRIVPKPQFARNNNALPEGYPDLPPAMITHPPDVPREYSKRALSAYIVEPPDILQIDMLVPADVAEIRFPIRGTHLVRPDGTIGLGAYGSVFVAGLTLDQIRPLIAQRIAEILFEGKEQREKKVPQLLSGLKVDVAAYNSKFYYVITDGGGYGEQVYRVLTTGNETVLDAIAQIAGLPAVASKKQIWIARATPAHSHGPNILPVDWCGITKRGEAGTNYQVYPGDRIYVNSDARIRIDTHLAKILSPIERLFGITLLGSTTVNSIKNGGNGGNGTGR